MQYKTITLEMLKQRPAIHERLCKHRELLPLVEACATELKTRHEFWKEQLAQKRADTDPTQVAGEAGEIALMEMEDRLQAAFPPDEMEPFSLDVAIAFIRNLTPPA